MMRKFGLWAALSAMMLLMASCKHGMQIEEGIARYVTNDTLRIERLYTGTEWDTLCVVKPYLAMEGYYQVDMEKADKAAIEDYNRFDNLCTLVFMKEGKLVAFAPVETVGSPTLTRSRKRNTPALPAFSWRERA